MKLTDLKEEYRSFVDIRRISSNVILCMVDIEKLSSRYFPGTSIDSHSLPVNEFDVFFEESGVAFYEKFSRFKFFRRQIEWCAGRLASAVLSQHQYGVVHQIQITENGAPFIPLCSSVSISHSGNYAVSAAALDDSTVVAVDIEIIKPFENIKSFLAIGFPEETAADMMTLPLQEVYRLWTLKECFLKITGRGFSEKLKRIRVTGSSFVYNEVVLPDIARETFTVDDHVISVIYADRKFTDELSFKLSSL